MSWKIYLNFIFTGPFEFPRAFFIIPLFSISLATVFTPISIVGFLCHPQPAVNITPQHKVTKYAIRANFSVSIQSAAIRPIWCQENLNKLSDHWLTLKDPCVFMAKFRMKMPTITIYYNRTLFKL